MHFDTATLALFLSAARLGSLSKAADHQHMSLPAASRRIALLEESLNVTLFLRKSSGVSLTTAGHAMLDYAQTIVRQVTMLSSEIADYSDGRLGRVRLQINSSALGQGLPEQLAQWIKLTPHVKIEVKEGRSKAIISSVGNGDADIGAVNIRTNSKSLRFRKLSTDPLCALVSKKMPMPPQACSFSDLLSSEFVLFDDDAAVTELLVETAVASEIPLRIKMKVNSMEVAARLVDAGCGVAILPASSAKIYSSALQVSSIPITDSWAERSSFLCIRADESDPAVLAFFDFLLRHTSD